MTLSSFYFELWLHIGDTFSLPANWLGLCALQFSPILCAFDCDSNLTHTLSLREAGTCATRSWSLCPHLCAYTHRSLVSFLSLVLAFVRLCPLMDGMQMPPCTTECNHSYYTGNSFSAPHSVQQLQHGTPATPAQLPASIQEVDGPASSGVISSSLLSCSAFSSQVTADPTRNGTGDDIPLAEAITQLSFLESYSAAASRFGDFNMSAFSTVGDVFTDEEFSAPGNSLLWRLGALEEPHHDSEIHRSTRRGIGTWMRGESGREGRDDEVWKHGRNRARTRQNRSATCLGRRREAQTVAVLENQVANMAETRVTRLRRAAIEKTMTRAKADALISSSTQEETPSCAGWAETARPCTSTSSFVVMRVICPLHSSWSWSWERERR